MGSDDNSNIEQFSESAALRLIESTLSATKKRISENGFIYLLWGWVVLIGNLACYYWFTQQNGPAIGYTWTVLGFGGGITTAIYYMRREKTEVVSTHMDTLVGHVWAGTGIGAAIFYAWLIIGDHYSLIAPFVLLATGMATYTTGRMVRFTPLVIGAICFWGCTIGMFFLEVQWHFIIGAAAMVPGYLVPGYMLRSLYKKQHVQEA